MQEDTLVEYDAYCPYCDTLLTLLIDPSQGSHVTWEDCHQCCAPIQLAIEVSLVTGELESVSLGSDDDVL
ncbi:MULTISPECIES: CPXCG motif-containing cysteine-rich protein [Halomonadaceae]|uniref:CPXCG motif-containing cysteine-rich protein n=1 Tax=Vreelandella janggokensis TaxID=370767 RepID=A0ABT4IPG8_9GAMM|nr:MULTISPECIES: CPXCG motif-containing cysteine-rich protein [Halomonas]MCO7246219.1 CPXCG motif-containing cysteine-rich protein [Halomonas sp. Mc5H-6]MCW4152419.1 CPXCG motif-containing cysteine-rich protein [Halomonas sp. 18H]MCZ0925560.1 CPXCG motif-containing cysteine-rich protein [Halomonas janggokensis]MDR5886929.1 CPXCG motif-containing cysteine-rich protein [Halomonas janggokensis]OAZ89977.1 hypothetical protein ADS46_08330 [Halomonas sp. G11]